MESPSIASQWQPKSQNQPTDAIVSITNTTTISKMTTTIKHCCPWLELYYQVIIIIGHLNIGTLVHLNIKHKHLNIKHKHLNIKHQHFNIKPRIGALLWDHHHYRIGLLCTHPLTTLPQPSLTNQFNDFHPRCTLLEDEFDQQQFNSLMLNKVIKPKQM